MAHIRLDAKAKGLSNFPFCFLETDEKQQNMIL